MLNSHIFQCDIEKCEKVSNRDVWTFPSIYAVTTWAQTKYLHTSPRLQSSDQLHSNRVLHFAVHKKKKNTQTTNILCDYLCSRWHGWSESSWRQQCEHPCMVMVWLMLCGGRDVSWPRSRSSIAQCKSGLLRLSRGIFTCCRPWIVFGCCHGCRQWQQ